MEVKNLFDAATKRDIIDRINQLTPQQKALWGKMTVTQMLAHCQMPLGVATGKHKLKRNFLLSLIGPLFKKQLNTNTKRGFEQMNEKLKELAEQK